MAYCGMDFGQISAACGYTNRDSIYKRLATDPAMALAVARGQANSIKMASAKFMKLIESGDKQMLMFFLERRAGWIKTEGRKNMDLRPADIADDSELAKAAEEYALIMKQ